MNFLMTPPGA